MLKQVRKQPAPETGVSGQQSHTRATPESTQRTYTQAELRKLNTQYIMRKDRDKELAAREAETVPAEINWLAGGISTGFMGYLALFGKCVGASLLAKLLLTGAVVVALGYGLLKLFA